jgi:hypothetical protein
MDTEAELALKAIRLKFAVQLKVRPLDFGNAGPQNSKIEIRHHSRNALIAAAEQHNTLARIAGS